VRGGKLASALGGVVAGGRVELSPAALLRNAAVRVRLQKPKHPKIKIPKHLNRALGYLGNWMLRPATFYCAF
jgi:hypothetical protein